MATQVLSRSRRAVPVPSRLSLRNCCVLIILLSILVSLLSAAVPAGQDWLHTYRPAARAVIQGQSPYTVEIYYAAPWAAWILAPVALLPDRYGRMAFFLISLAAYMYTAYRLGARGASLLIFLCSSVVLGCLFEGNIEWLALLGAVLPAPIGLIFLAIKPQVGIGLGVYWLVTIWREQGFRQAAITFAPVTVLLALSFLLYGLWPLRFSQTVAWSSNNASLFSYGSWIPGIFLLFEALRIRDARAALASGPMLSPYVILFTLAAMLVYFLDKPWKLLGLVVLLWIPQILKLL